MRDRDRLENELLELRAVADALDGSLRRLAAGDIYQNIDMAFPRAFEGMRKDFNRGLRSLSTSLDEIISRTRELRSESEEMRRGLHVRAEEENSRAAAVSAALVSLASVENATRSQAARADHVSAILHNARLDLDRPRQATAQAGSAAGDARGSLSRLKALVDDLRPVVREAALLALNSGVNAAHTAPASDDTLGVAKTFHAITQQIETTLEAIGHEADGAMGSSNASGEAIAKLGREFEAHDLYLEAADTQARALGDGMRRGGKELEAIRADLVPTIRRLEDPDKVPHPPLFHLDAIDRAAAEIDRQAERFKPSGELLPPFTPAPGSGRRGHLTLVKS